MTKGMIQVAVVVLFGLSLSPLKAAEANTGEGPLGVSAGVPVGSGPSAPLGQPSPLSGLWAVSIGGGFPFRRTPQPPRLFRAGSLGQPGAIPLPRLFPPRPLHHHA